MRDQTPLIVVACYGTLVGGSLPFVQMLRYKGEHVSVAVGLLLLVVFLYSLVRFRWRLRRSVDENYEALAPPAFHVAVVLIAPVIELQLFGRWESVLLQD